MSGDKGNRPTLTAAIRRVLDGDVNAYGIIYETIDKPLRCYIGIMYRRHDYEIRDEIAVRTHEFIFENLSRYDPARASFQRWANLASRNVALRVMTERFNLHKVETERGTWKRESISIAMDEEALSLATKAGPDSNEALWLKHVLWQEYSALAREGRLSLALHVVEGRPLPETAKLLNTLIKLRGQIPLFMGRYSMKAVMAKGAKGDYATLQVQNAGHIEDLEVLRFLAGQFDAFKDKPLIIEREPGDDDDEVVEADTHGM